MLILFDTFYFIIATVTMGGLLGLEWTGHNNVHTIKLWLATKVNAFLNFILMWGQLGFVSFESSLYFLTCDFLKHAINYMHSLGQCV